MNQYYREIKKEKERKQLQKRIRNNRENMESCAQNTKAENEAHKRQLLGQQDDTMSGHDFIAVDHVQEEPEDCTPFNYYPPEYHQIKSSEEFSIEEKLQQLSLGDKSELYGISKENLSASIEKVDALMGFGSQLREFENGLSDSVEKKELFQIIFRCAMRRHGCSEAVQDSVLSLMNLSQTYFSDTPLPQKSSLKEKNHCTSIHVCSHCNKHIFMGKNDEKCPNCSQPRKTNVVHYHPFFLQYMQMRHYCSRVDSLEKQRERDPIRITDPLFSGQTERYTKLRNSNEHWLFLCHSTDDVKMTGEKGKASVAYNLQIQFTRRHAFDLILTNCFGNANINPNLYTLLTFWELQYLHMRPVKLPSGKRLRIQIASGVYDTIELYDSILLAKRFNHKLAGCAQCEVKLRKSTEGEHIFHGAAPRKKMEDYYSAALELLDCSKKERDACIVKGLSFFFEFTRFAFDVLLQTSSDMFHVHDAVYDIFLQSMSNKDKKELNRILKEIQYPPAVTFHGKHLTDSNAKLQDKLVWLVGMFPHATALFSCSPETKLFINTLQSLITRLFGKDFSPEQCLREGAALRELCIRIAGKCPIKVHNLCVHYPVSTITIGSPLEISAKFSEALYSEFRFLSTGTVNVVRRCFSNHIDLKYDHHRLGAIIERDKVSGLPISDDCWAFAVDMMRPEERDDFREALPSLGSIKLHSVMVKHTRTRTESSWEWSVEYMVNYTMLKQLPLRVVQHSLQLFLQTSTYNNLVAQNPMEIVEYLRISRRGNDFHTVAHRRHYSHKKNGTLVHAWVLLSDGRVMNIERIFGVFASGDQVDPTILVVYGEILQPLNEQEPYVYDLESSTHQCLDFDLVKYPVPFLHIESEFIQQKYNKIRVGVRFHSNPAQV